MSEQDEYEYQSEAYDPYYYDSNDLIGEAAFNKFIINDGINIFIPNTNALALTYKE